MRKNGVIKIGKIDVSALVVPPEKHEYETARYFAKLGLEITFIQPSFMKGCNTPDFTMQDKDWETKSPITYSKSSFEHNLRKATNQSPNIIFDLRRLSKSDEQKYTIELSKWGKYQKINILLIITTKNELLTIKGKFDI